MDHDKKVVTFCIIEAPLLERQKLGIERVAKVMTFDAEPRRSADGKYQSFVLSLNKDDATAIVCNVERFVGRYMPAPSECTHVAWLQTANPRDFEKICAMDDWKKIPVTTPKDSAAKSTEESLVSPEELEDPLIMVRG